MCCSGSQAACRAWRLCCLFSATLDPGQGSVQLLIVIKHGDRQGHSAGAGPGSAVDSMPMGLSPSQQALGFGCLSLPTLTLRSGTMTLDHAVDHDAVVDEVSWPAGTEGRFNIGGHCRLSITPALTSAVQCGALGRVVAGHCALQLGTMHVGRLAQLEGRVAFL